MSDPLVKALESTKGPHQEYAEELAIGIREALPEGVYLFTEDSLAAAHATLKGHDGQCSSVFGRCASWDAVYATFQAVKEAERE